MARRTCGGCEGKGAHWRWCPEHVGRTASMYGQWAQQAEDLADSVGSNCPGAANALYSASGSLRDHALQAKQRFQSSTDTA